MSIFRKKEETKKYSFEEMVELSRISSNLVECQKIDPYGNPEYLNFRLELIDEAQARWNRFAAIHPEFEEVPMLKMNLEILKMQRKTLMCRLEMMAKEGRA